MLKPVEKERFILMSITNIREVRVGRVVPFTRSSQQSEEMYYIPAWLANADPVKFYVEDDSFQSEGITAGTLLICRRKFDLWEVTPGRLSIVHLNGDYRLQRVFVRPNGTVRLLRCGCGGETTPSKAEVTALVEIQQIVRH
jgi:hypothetical protein